MRLAFSFTLIFVAACGDPDDPERSVVELGRLEFFDDPAVITIPPSVMKGQPFQVHVVTRGGGCIAFEETEVQVASDGVDFLPYDRRRIPPPGFCTLEDADIIHESDVVFNDPGPQTIRIHGRRVNNRVDEQIIIPVTVSVQ